MGSFLVSFWGVRCCVARVLSRNLIVFARNRCESLYFEMQPGEICHQIEIRIKTQGAFNKTCKLKLNSTNFITKTTHYSANLRYKLFFNTTQKNYPGLAKNLVTPLPYLEQTKIPQKGLKLTRICFCLQAWQSLGHLSLPFHVS